MKVAIELLIAGSLACVLCAIWLPPRRQPHRHTRITVGSRCNLDEPDDAHPWGPWSAPYGVAGETRQFRERRCTIDGCQAGQWRPADEVTA